MKTESSFEEQLFDDMIKDVERLRATNPKGDYDTGWNTGIKSCIYRLYSFFGRGNPPANIMNEFAAPSSSGNYGSYGNHERDVTPTEIRPLIEDPINHPSWYCEGGIETIDFIMAKRLDFLLRQVCKYISRAGKKDPSKEVEDLQKARFYLDWKINLLKREE